jgi:DNA helicase-2/ATP-dependent DNA helicase PcrA
MTIHSAKGLEFPVVFLVGMEDGVFPHSRSIGDESELEEERRLAYVAITRAEKVLYVSHAMRRRVYGDEIAAEPSQFLNELPLELIEDISYGPSWLSYARDAGMGSSSDRYLEASANEPGYSKPKNLYTGKTYNNADAISEFFKNRGGNFPQSRQAAKEEGKEDEERRPSPLKGFDKLRSQATPKRENEGRQAESSGVISSGSHVRHPKYGVGLVLRREGSGDNVKLTISFPGHGQKKLIEKYANLQKA